MEANVQLLIDSIEKVIVGKTDIIKKVISSLLCDGHILIEDVPGVGKTQLVASLARSLHGKFNRIQMTPDIMPSDILGFSMLNPQTKDFEYRDGVAMCNFLLADEINRASPKAQSSLLEVMEEYQISLDGVTRKLPRPFMVLATQNPVETYGTYHLPEAQMDRFLLKISMGYPSIEEEKLIIERTESQNPINLINEPVLNLEDIVKLQQQVTKVKVSEKVRDYILDIVNATRNNDFIVLGVSPRGSISLYKAAKAVAFIEGRNFVTPNDIAYIANEVLSHRIILSAKGKTVYHTSSNLLSEIFKTIAIPM